MQKSSTLPSDLDAAVTVVRGGDGGEVGGNTVRGCEHRGKAGQEGQRWEQSSGL